MLMHAFYLESPVQSQDKACLRLNEFLGNPDIPADCEMRYDFSGFYGPWSLLTRVAKHTFLFKTSTYFFCPMTWGVLISQREV